MSRKSGKPPRKNPFLEKDRSQLLDELNSIQEMLGDAARDVDEESIPTLTEENAGAAKAAADKAKSKAEGDAENQIPLLEPDGAGAKKSGDKSGTATSGQSAPANQRLREALKQRENPFLSAAGEAADKRNAAQSTPQTPEKPSEPPAPAPSADDTGSGKSLTEEEMRAMVDELLAAWLPKIERELRARLMEYLREQ